MPRGLRPDHARSCDELAADGPTEEEVERARAYAAGSTVLALEGEQRGRAPRGGAQVTFDEVVSPEVQVAALDAVTYDEVREVARGSPAPPVVACVGPHEVADFE